MLVVFAEIETNLRRGCQLEGIEKDRNPIVGAVEL